MSTCPKCGAPTGFLTGSYIEIRGPEQSWVGVSCVCPKCDTILAISVDSIALKNDVAEEIVTRLQTHSDDGS